MRAIETHMKDSNMAEYGVLKLKCGHFIRSSTCIKHVDFNSNLGVINYFHQFPDAIESFWCLAVYHDGDTWWHKIAGEVRQYTFEEVLTQLKSLEGMDATEREETCDDG